MQFLETEMKESQLGWKQTATQSECTFTWPDFVPILEDSQWVTDLNTFLF